ncbi:MAG: hypothetical protein AAGG51_29120 [Cyanobacteria bacterium P01_G01_bin.54]
MDNFLKGTLCIANGVVLAGLIGATLNQSDRAFDLSFWLRGWSQRHQPPDASLAQLINHPTCPANPETTVLSPQQAQSLQTQLAQGARFQDLSQVTPVLGTPTCQTQTPQGTVLIYAVSNQTQILVGDFATGVRVEWLPQ